MIGFRGVDWYIMVLCRADVLGFGSSDCVLVLAVGVDWYIAV